MMRLPLPATLLIAVLSAVTASSGSAGDAEHCDAIATNCLGICAGFDLSTKEGDRQYGRCVMRCDARRNTCIMDAESGRGLTVAPDEPTAPGSKLIAPGIESTRSQ